MAFAHVLDRHAEEASELWVLRARAAFAPHYKRGDLARLDERVEANLDGLRMAGEPGSRATSSLELRHPGAAFARAAQALSRRDAKGFAKVLDSLEDSPHLISGVLGALAWVPLERASWAVRALLHGSCPPILRRFGLAAHVAHRSDPGIALTDALRATSAPLRAAAIEGAGKLGRTDLLDEVRDDVSNTQTDVRAAAAWTAVLLGDEDACSTLWEFVDADTPRGRSALSLVLSRTRPDMGHARLAAWSRDPEKLRLAIVGFGLLGAREGLPLVIERIDDPAVARVAGEAFHRITGLPIKGALKGEAMEGAPAGPTDDPDDDKVAPDPDGELPWPKVDAVRRAHFEWQKGAVPSGRLLFGESLTVDRCELELRRGSQRDRAAAAIERAVLQAGALVDVAKPAFRARGGAP